MSEDKASRAPEPLKAESPESVSARSNSTEAEWTRRFSLVRKQEFAYLRGVIKREGGDASGQTLAGLPMHASTAERVRGNTLKKIDEIEAQLDLLWLSSHSKVAPSGFGVEGSLPGLETSQATGPNTAPFASTRPDTVKGVASRMHHSEIPSSALLIPPLDTAAAPGAALGQNLPAPPAHQVRVQAPCDATVSAAAALFARADYATATQILQRALGVSQDRTVRLQQLLALLEIYRVTGHQDQFDASVLEYFDYWDGKTPQWHTSMKARDNTGITGISDATDATAEPKFAEKPRFDASSPDGARTLQPGWPVSDDYGIDWARLSTLDATAPDLGLTIIEPAPLWKASEIHLMDDALAPFPLPAPSAQDSLWQLSGHVLGASGLGLPDPPEHPAPQRITVSCEALVRMDADAVAQLVQWLRNAREKRADVHLQDVGVLVGAAWVAAGIDALAQLHLRNLD